MTKSALVLFSGGQDSTICLAYALERYARVETLAFDYNQRHKVELDCRLEILKHIPTQNREWGERLGDDHILPLPALAEIGGTSLIGAGEIKMQENGLPSSFVPGRNLLFLTYGAALAYRRGLDVLVGGMCETDYSGYPDCRRTTLDALTNAINLGMESAITIDTPLMQQTKAQSWALANEIGGAALVSLIIEHSHTCYEGERNHRHIWGYGCGTCPACKLRAQGYQEWTAA
ncbi:MAG: 7-cyano-7-deazaguanine synthase QueC [Alphaproteobacteria bacterium]|nr:7-cyano-7-deazaguanine synthase QueC [Alphaproteobacteria bacterium]MBE8220509.1 7-cyano-7-deazaguanine synthase QueC [Alphaproteobacteria bacterium]